MNFTGFDIGIIIVMSLAVISMSFVFPALGLTGQEAQENDIPEFNMTADRYEFRDEFPDSPGAPTEGDMHWNEEEPDAESSQSIFLDGDSSSGVEIAVVNSNTTEDPEMEVFIQNWTDGSGIAEDSVVLQNESDYGQVTYQDWTVTVEWTRARHVNSSDFRAVVHFTVTNQPSDSSWFDRVPIVGSIFSAGEELAAIVGWIGSILYWIMGTVISIIWQAFAILFDIISYGFDMMVWLLTTYWDIVDGASAWASVFVMIPGIALFLEFTKIAYIGVDLIWLG